MAAGCPVLVTPEVGVAPAIVAAQAGWVVPGEPQTLGPRLSELAANAQLRHDMGARGKVAAREQFGWDRVAERMDAAYVSLLR
jgi:glycosyltransferase involved in cell wall biosynthesis